MRRLVEHRISLGEGEKIQELGYKAAAGGNKNIQQLKDSTSYLLTTNAVPSLFPNLLRNTQVRQLVPRSLLAALLCRKALLLPIWGQ